MRMTNCYFEHAGPYSKKHPLRKRLVRTKEREWGRALGTESAEFPRPPDLRTLFVREGMGYSTNDDVNDLWTKACRDVQSMSRYARNGYLNRTHHELIEQIKDYGQGQ